MVWRQFMEREQKLPEGHPDSERRDYDIEAREMWKQYRRCIWWCGNTNPMLPGGPVDEPEEPPVAEPQDLWDFLDAIKRRFPQASAEYITKLENFPPLPGQGVETIYGHFNEIAEVVEASGAYTPAMLAVRFHCQLPTHVQIGMASRYQEEGMRRRREKLSPMSRKDVRQMAIEEETWSTTAAAAVCSERQSIIALELGSNKLG